jgi:hypothetical protein
MSSLRLDMSELHRICLIKPDLAQQKSTSGAKTMNLGPDKLTTCKLSTKKLREKREQLETT